jgi:hypothetical protein
MQITPDGKKLHTRRQKEPGKPTEEISGLVETATRQQVAQLHDSYMTMMMTMMMMMMMMMMRMMIMMMQVVVMVVVVVVVVVVVWFGRTLTE